MARVPSKIGQFEIVGLLGKGAMGEVYEGIDKDLARRVALKVLGRKHQESNEFKTRFLREGRALASMNHPNVVQVYFIGEWDGRPFLAMEFLDGYDIGAALKKDGPIRPGDAAEVIRQSAIGLMVTQQSGVVHRDVKPSNLVVTGDGAVKVTDFGLAKALQEDLSITATGVFVGTPDYLAPEQAMGEDVDASADIYALGCSLFHMCTGHPPFRRGGADDHYTAVVRRHLKSERPLLTDEIPGFDEELSAICRRMMSRRPEVRPDFEELSETMGRISERLRGQVPPRHTALHTSSVERSGPVIDVTEVDSPTDVVEPETGGSKGLMLGIGIGIGVGIVLAGAAALLF